MSTAYTMHTYPNCTSNVMYLHRIGENKLNKTLVDKQHSSSPIEYKTNRRTKE